MADASARPMSLAEAAECCGQYRWGHWALDGLDGHEAHCENCPLLIERKRDNPDVLRAARAM